MYQQVAFVKLANYLHTSFTYTNCVNDVNILGCSCYVI